MIGKDIENSLQYIDDDNIKDGQKNDGSGDVVTKQPVNEVYKMEEIPLSNSNMAAEKVLCTAIICNCLTEWWAAFCGCIAACCEFDCIGCFEGACEGLAECMYSCGDCCVLCMECCKT